ncbi:hypothetical protein T492DRAFT_845308 [Pavlovales sp. CCMP2436]|nr:hypothetical protein T492DRAFT_845308 [Pavlovales sp. CCMP2436]
MYPLTAETTRGAVEVAPAESMAASRLDGTRAAPAAVGEVSAAPAVAPAAMPVAAASGPATDSAGGAGEMLSEMLIAALPAKSVEVSAGPPAEMFSLSFLIDGSAQPLVVIDCDGDIKAINASALQCFNGQPELVGLPISALVPSPSAQELCIAGIHVCQTRDGHGLVCFTKRAGSLAVLNMMPGVPSDSDLALALTSSAERAEPGKMPSPLPTLLRDVGLKADMVRDMCEHNGYLIDVCDNGPDALARIFDPASSYNLVLLDLVMSPMHGLDILKVFLFLF